MIPTFCIFPPCIKDNITDLELGIGCCKEYRHHFFFAWDPCYFFILYFQLNQIAKGMEIEQLPIVDLVHTSFKSVEMMWFSYLY